MENSIKPIEIDDDYADILKIKEQYAYRFGYTRPKEDLIAFKNRTIAAKKAGKAVVKVKVTLKNGKTKTVKMTIKVTK